MHYYKYDTIEDKHPDKEFIKADEILDPDGELLPVERFVEIQNNMIRESCRLKDKPSDTLAESVAINNTNTTPDSISSMDDDDIEQSFDLTSKVKQAYRKDKLYSKILEKLKAHALFSCKDGLVFTKNLLKWDILCISREAFVKGRQLIAIIIDHAQ